MSNRRTGNYYNYVRLLNKYKTRQPMEKRSLEYYREESENARINEYLHMSESIMDSMKLQGTQRRDLKWLVQNVSFNELNRKARAECIIVCLCIYIRRSYGDNFRWQAYSIVKNNNLTCNTLLTVITNLCIWYSRRGIMPRSDNVDKYGTVSIIEDDEGVDYSFETRKTLKYGEYSYRRLLNNDTSL